MGGWDTLVDPCRPGAVRVAFHFGITGRPATRRDAQSGGSL